MKTSDQLELISAALTKAQGEFKIALKDAANSFFKSNYADFQSVVDAVRPALLKHGLAFVQMTRIDEKLPMVLVTRIIHSSGQWIEGEYPVRTSKDDPQSLGAAITYSKRYALQSALGVVASNDDDDAEGSMDREKPDAPASKAAITWLIKSFSGVGVSESQVLKHLGIKNSELITEKQMADMKLVGSDIKSGKVKASEYFGESK